MPLRITGNRLVIDGDPQTAGMARLKLDNGHHVIVYVAEIPGGYGFFPIELTLPVLVLEQVEARRQEQRNVQASYFDAAFSSNRRDRERALSAISRLEKKLHEPLLCTTIQLGSLLTVWAPEVPEWRNAVLDIGTVTHIEMML